MLAVIMAGGKGTRIASLNNNLPKPMLPIAGSPILEHIIISLAKQEIKDIILIVGYKSEEIISYFQEGNKWNVQITYIIEKSPLGTAGALFFLKERIKEDFLLINGDIIFDVDIKRMMERHRVKKGKATILTHPNNHPFDSGIIMANEEGRVTGWLHKEDNREWYKNRVNAGIHILSYEILETFTEIKRLDLDRDILKKLIIEEQLFCYDSSEYVKDVGTPQRFELVEHDILNGYVQKRNLQNKQKAIFIDRDGTINKHIGFLTNIDEFELLPDVDVAIKQINNSQYLAIVITNQPAIARGELTKDGLKRIHNKMETLLGYTGAYLDGIFYCPHHPDRGYQGEVKDLKMQCNCRKPKPGLLNEAAKKFNIDLNNSWMVGDSQIDIDAGTAAGCKVALISSKREKMRHENIYTDLKKFVESIL